MMMVRYFLVLSVAALLSACSTDGEERHEYLDSAGLQNLEVPPQLTRPSSGDELLIPEPSARVMAELQKNSQLTGNVAPAFKNVRVNSEQGIYWLELEQDADSLWPLLHDFLAHEGLKVERDEPLLGFVDTEWVKEYEASREDSGLINNLLSKFSPNVVDKFRLRLERAVNGKGSRIYASHRGLEKMMLNEGTQWVSRPSEPALEKEILYRMVLFVGASKLQADSLFAAYKPYQSRVRKLGEEGSDYEIVGQLDFVWRRLLQAMDRLGADIARQDKKTGQLDVLVSEIPDALLTELEKQADESWLNRMLQGDNAEQTPESGKLAVFLKLQPAGTSMRMTMQLSDGVEIKAGLAAQFRESLITLLK
ncbi:MAG: outer membrane protein assembly factor BamC [Gammaproteobacteria bacterium]|nr:outer membrane protein assembly factor BamC [Gammaproteobacteria bacterium]